MIATNHTKRTAARNQLARRGMVHLRSANGREYWGYTNRANVLLDHSATVTQVANDCWHVTDFSA